MRIAEPIGTLAATWAAAAIQSDDISVIVACAAGSYASFSWGEPVEPRSRMWNIGIASIIMGWAFTTLVNLLVQHLVPGMELTRAAHAGLGAVVSCLTRFWMEWLVVVIKTGSWIEYVPFLRKRG